MKLNLSKQILPFAVIGTSIAVILILVLSRSSWRMDSDFYDSAEGSMLETRSPPATRSVDLQAIEAEMLPQPKEAPNRFSANSAALAVSEGVNALNAGSIEVALSKFQEAVTADPTNVSAHQNLGRLHLQMSSLEIAATHLEEAASLDPENPEVWLDLLSFYERSMLLERAHYARRRIDALAPNQKLVKDWRGFWRFEGTTYQ